MASRLHRTLAWALVIVAASAAAPAQAQQHDPQVWFQANTNVPLADHVRVTLEQIARTSDRQEGLYQTEFGALLGFRILKGVELGVGYRKVGAHNGNNAGNEDRLRQQVVATVGPVVMRLRVDERFADRGSEVGFRVRPLVRYNHRIGRDGWAVFVSHESFYLPNTTDAGQRRGYERMRNIAGVAVPLGKRMIADVGYLNQYRFGRGGARAQMDHALTVQLTINLQSFRVPRVND